MAKTTCGSKRLIVVSISSRDNFFISNVYKEKSNPSSALPTSSTKIHPEQMMDLEGCKGIMDLEKEVFFACLFILHMLPSLHPSR